MKPPSLQSRIRNGSLIVVLLIVAVGAYALPQIGRLGGAIRDTLQRNYISIDAAHHMHASLHRLQVAELKGDAHGELPSARDEFTHWMDIENHDFTEIGEPDLAHDIQKRATRLFGEIDSSPPGSHHDAEFDQLHQRLDALIAMNQAAMFRADSRAWQLSHRLAYNFAAGLGLIMVAGIFLSWTLGWALARPLRELSERLHGIGQRHTNLRIGPQRLAELDAVAREFNQMAEQLEHYEKLNVERLVYEKSKTEAIVESLEDGVVLVDSEGVITHINEIAAIILGLDPSEALGNPFDDLSSNHPHYLRIRDALRTLRRTGVESQRVEVELHVRGRDHTYVLKPVPLTHTGDRQLGTLVILQDVTYLRDQDRARVNLVATLSHELRTPLTSLAISADLIRREEAASGGKYEDLVRAILQDCARMRNLVDNLLNLARGEAATIALRRERIDFGRLAEEVSNRFRIQAEAKHVELVKRIEPVPVVLGDPVKLSWVVSNLLGNALRYTPDGGKIEVVARPENGSARLEVADSGPGIEPELRDHIFERFAQYDANGAQKGSAGLGLAIVKDIVEAHGGRIFLDTEVGKGSHFIVDLPASPEA